MKLRTEHMEHYINDLPYFLFFVVLGIVVNFLYTARKKEITRGRLAREFIGGLWVSLLIFIVLDEFFDFSKLFVYGMCSLAGFGNSRLLDFLQKDFWEFLILQGQEAVKNLVARLKRNNNETTRYYPPEFPDEMGEGDRMDEEESNDPNIPTNEDR